MSIRMRRCGDSDHAATMLLHRDGPGKPEKKSVPYKPSDRRSRQGRSCRNDVVRPTNSPIRSATSGPSRLECVVNRVDKTHGTAFLIGRREFLVVERLPAAALALLMVDSQIRK